MLSDRLKELIISSGKKQLEIAKDLNFTQQRFNFYVSGKREPDNETLAEIARYFNVSVDYLLGVDEKEQKNTHLSETERRVLELMRTNPEIGEKLIDLISTIENFTSEQAQALITILKARQ